MDQHRTTRRSRVVGGTLVRMGEPWFTPPKSIFAVGSHPDDLELGAMGTLLKWREAGSHLHLLIVTLGDQPEVREAESKAVIQRFLDDAAVTYWRLSLGDIPVSRSLVDEITRLAEMKSADCVFVHHPNDRHQDHQQVTKLVLAGCRDVRTLLFYETQGSTLEFRPHFFVDIEDYMESKIEAVTLHASQAHQPYMAPDAIWGLAASRAAMVRRVGYYEAFECLRMDT